MKYFKNFQETRTTMTNIRQTEGQTNNGNQQQHCIFKKPPENKHKNHLKTKCTKSRWQQRETTVHYPLQHVIQTTALACLPDAEAVSVHESTGTVHVVRPRQTDPLRQPSQSAWSLHASLHQAPASLAVVESVSLSPADKTHTLAIAYFVSERYRQTASDEFFEVIRQGNVISCYAVTLLFILQTCAVVELRFCSWCLEYEVVVTWGSELWDVLVYDELLCFKCVLSISNLAFLIRLRQMFLTRFDLIYKSGHNMQPQLSNYCIYSTITASTVATALC